MIMAVSLERHVQSAPSTQSFNVRRLRYPATSPASNNKIKAGKMSCLTLFSRQVLDEHIITPYMPDAEDRTSTLLSVRVLTRLPFTLRFESGRHARPVLGARELPSS